MDPAQPPNMVSDESQRALETNVFVSAKNSQTQADSLHRIAADMNVIKWAAVFSALMLLLLVIR